MKLSFDGWDVHGLLHNWAAVAAVSSAAVVCLVIIIALLVHRKALQAQLVRADQLLTHIQHSRGLEKNLDYLLEVVGTMIDAPVYAFYVYDAKNGQYFLKTVRHSESDFGKVAPSYSGLKPYKKEDYLPPISLRPADVPGAAGPIKDGEVPLFLLPLGEKGVIRIGPAKAVKRKTRNNLIRFGKQVAHVLAELVESESIRNQVEVVAASAKALQNISNVAVDPAVTMEVMIGASRKAVGASGGFFLEWKRQAGAVISGANADKDMLDRLSGDAAALQVFFAMGKEKGTTFITRGSPAFYELPAYMAAAGFGTLSVTPIGSRGALVFLFDQLAGEEQVRSETSDKLGLIAGDLTELIDSQAPLQRLSKVYVNILKKLAQMADNLNPYTVGYSEQMSRYSIVVAKQLGLPEDEIRDIALAAHLSNIGVLGLSGDLYQKDGKFSEVEYELMKLHAEVGASIVSVTTGNKRAASYILYHHERVDGAGYPAGLSGGEIPVGARILAVVQTFLAKINGRKMREPHDFNQALRTLESASGSQLDAQVVQALMSWFQNKRNAMRASSRSLGACWEMCCTPSSICQHCPVYAKADVNCWEVEGNHCSEHGKSCASCFVRTEAQQRSEVKIRA